ncbi:MAG: hypothetical protein WAY93_08205 [Atopobiaceae bacterium]|jgi:hypothetical protein|nr:hypothetical protein [Atopobiaceae bacterium]
MDEGADARADGIQEPGDEESRAALREAEVSEIPDEALSGVSGGRYLFSDIDRDCRVDISVDPATIYISPTIDVSVDPTVPVEIEL